MDFPVESLKSIIAWYKNPTDEGKYKLIGDHGRICLWIEFVGDKNPPVMQATKEAGLSDEDKVKLLEGFYQSHGGNAKKMGAVAALPAWLIPILVDLSGKAFDKLKQWFGF